MIFERSVDQGTDLPFSGTPENQFANASFLKGYRVQLFQACSMRSVHMSAKKPSAAELMAIICDATGSAAP